MILIKLFDQLQLISPGVKRTIFKMWYQYLAGLPYGAELLFMNYGYAPPGPGYSGPELKHEDEPYRLFIQLYNYVLQNMNLTGKTVLEAGCGRGGGASYIARYYKPRIMHGLDFSRKVIRFCRKHHNEPNLSLVEGNAEALPFPENHFDVVVNVESSHCYGSIQRFADEVYRVLKPGCFFQFADIRKTDLIEETHAGFLFREKEIITPAGDIS